MTIPESVRSFFGTLRDKTGSKNAFRWVVWAVSAFFDFFARLEQSAYDSCNALNNISIRQEECKAAHIVYKMVKLESHLLWLVKDRSFERNGLLLTL